MDAFDIFRFLPARGPIPPAFHRECGDGPFSHCDACSLPFSELRGYSVLKEYRGERCTFEFALCFECALALGQQISEESAERLTALVQSPPMRATPPTADACAFCQTARPELEQYSTRIRCRESEWIDGPEIFCGGCEKMFDGALSKQTRDEFEDWFRENVPGLPTSEIDIEALISRL